jgi:hypothetical protein
MTHFLPVFFLLFSPSPSLSASDAWFCTASGLDHQGNIRQVSGEYESSRRLAERSALSRCQGIGLATCRMESCFNFGAPGEERR